MGEEKICIIARNKVMKILVTGANGYLGTGVVKQLCYDFGHGK